MIVTGEVEWVTLNAHCQPSQERHQAMASQLLVAKNFQDSTDSVELYILAMPFQSTRTDGEAE